MNKPTSGPWKGWGSCIYGETGNVCAISDPHAKETIGYAPLEFGSKSRGEAYANAALIVAAVNACFAINPDNPQAVADGMAELVKACREASRFLSELSGNGVAHVQVGPAIGTLGAALAKLEAK